MINRVKNILALLSGASLSLAFSPIGYYPFAIIAPAILLWTWLDCTNKQAFWRGLLFGLGLFGVGTSWVYISIHEFGNTSAFISTIITALFTMVLALFPAMQGYGLKRLLPEDKPSKLLMAFPASWALFEWFRGWALSGFPWLFLGYSQTNSPLMGLIPILGVWGTSFILCLLAALLINAYQQSWRHAWKSLLPLTLFIVCSVAVNNIHWTHTEGQPVKVSLLQGNIPQQLKWSPDYIQTTLRRYYEMTATQWDSDVIIWPEAAIPLLFSEAKPFITRLANEVQLHKKSLVLGIPMRKEGYLDRYYNAMLVLGNAEGKYFKRHLVPFGEYVPLGNWLRGLIGFFDMPMSDFTAGDQQQGNLRVGRLLLAPFICYEVAYEDQTYSAMPSANAMLTITNDAWFGDSLAPAQHLQIAATRALQSGRYMLFVANNGITAIIDPYGQVVKSLPQFEQGVLKGSIYPMQGITPWMRMGNTTLLLIFTLCLVMALARRSDTKD